MCSLWSVSITADTVTSSMCVASSLFASLGADLIAGYLDMSTAVCFCLVSILLWSPIWVYSPSLPVASGWEYHLDLCHDIASPVVCGLWWLLISGSLVGGVLFSWVTVPLPLHLFLLRHNLLLLWLAVCFNRGQISIRSCSKKGYLWWVPYPAADCPSISVCCCSFW